MVCSWSGGRRRKRATSAPTCCRSMPTCTWPARQNCSKAATLALARTLCCAKRPSARRSSGTSPSPRVRACGGAFAGTVTPSIVMVPARRRSAPITARASSVRPAPIRPEKPTISPAHTRKEISCTRSVVNPSTSSAHGPGVRSAAGKPCPNSRPTIRAISCSSSRSAACSQATRSPSRKTVTRSASAMTSASLCDT